MIDDITRRDYYLHTMGIQPWRLNANKIVKPQNSAVTSQTDGNLSDVAQLDWQSLKTRVADCTLCGLEKTRTKTVFGAGNLHADLLIVGEAPGANEDRQGEPFVGRAGLLLNAMLRAIGLQREQIYITNVLKCRPPNNRDPEPFEVKCCTPYLERQIALLKPKLILAVGRIAAQYLLNTTATLGKLRGQTFRFGVFNIPLLVTYHPAYLLRAPKEKAKAYHDLCQASRLLKQLCTDGI